MSPLALPVRYPTPSRSGWSPLSRIKRTLSSSSAPMSGHDHFYTLTLLTKALLLNHPRKVTRSRCRLVLPRSTNGTSASALDVQSSFSSIIQNSVLRLVQFHSLIQSLHSVTRMRTS